MKKDLSQKLGFFFKKYFVISNSSQIPPITEGWENFCRPYLRVHHKMPIKLLSFIEKTIFSLKKPHLYSGFVKHVMSTYQVGQIWCQTIQLVGSWWKWYWLEVWTGCIAIVTWLWWSRHFWKTEEKGYYQFLQCRR